MAGGGWLAVFGRRTWSTTAPEIAAVASGGVGGAGSARPRRAAQARPPPAPPPRLPPPAPTPTPPPPPPHSYVNTAACKSAISYIDGDKGILRYRGYPIEQLAARCTFPEVAHLVIYGRLPTGGELVAWEEALARHSALPPPVVEAVAALPHDAHFMGTVLTGA